MREMKIIEDEKRRLDDLYSYALLGTVPEICFDQLCKLAATICNTPIALISFIDSETQWFKSTFGVSLTSIDIKESLCELTIKQKNVLVIPDIDIETSRYDFVKNNGIRFYAGIPLISQDGHNVGTLCVMDYVPRKLTPSMKTSLEIIAKEIMSQVLIRKTYRENMRVLLDADKKKVRPKQEVLEHVCEIQRKAQAELATGIIFQMNDPLNLIKGRIKHLEETNQHTIDLEILSTCVKRMDKIIDSLDCFLNIEINKYMAPFDISDLTDEIMLSLKPEIEELGVAVNIDQEKSIMGVGNKDQLAVAIKNVILNALDALKDGDQKELHLILRKRDHHAEIRIMDAGKGVAEEVRDYIFKPFFSTKGNAHMGMGLALSKNLLQRHKGDVRIDRLNNPTTFTITLPLP